MVPPEVQYYFTVAGIRISQKQELRVTAGDVVRNNSSAAASDSAPLRLCFKTTNHNKRKAEDDFDKPPRKLPKTMADAATIEPSNKASDKAEAADEDNEGSNKREEETKDDEQERVLFVM